MEQESKGIERVILWAVSRSRSTAFERAIMQHRDVKIFHEVFSEPYLHDYYPEKHHLISEVRKKDGSSIENISYENSMKILLEDPRRFGKKLLFTKEISYFFDFKRIDPKWLARFKHTFLVRNPTDAMESLYRVSRSGDTTYFDPSESGFEELYGIYRLVLDACGEDNTIVFDADDDLMRDAEGSLRRFCAFAGIDFDPGMLEWKPERVPMWQFFKGWHNDAEASSGFNAVRHETLAFPAEVYEVAKSCEPYYRFFKWRAARKHGHEHGTGLQCLFDADSVEMRFLIVADGDTLPPHAQSLAAFLPESVGIWLCDASVFEGSALHGKANVIEALFDLPLAICGEAPSRSAIDLVRCLRQGTPLRQCLLRVVLIGAGDGHVEHDRLGCPLSIVDPSDAASADAAGKLWHQLRDDLRSQCGTSRDRMIAFNLEKTKVETPKSWADEFAAVVERHPDQLAVTDGQRSLTVNEWRRASEDVARILQDGGVCGKWIAIFKNRDADTAVAMTGCLLGGCPFVEIPTWYGSDHVGDILDLVEPALVLTTQGYAAELPGTVRAVPIDVEIGPADPSAQFARPLSPAAAGEQDCAYGILTSGTTGLAKLVKVQTPKILDSLQEWRRYFRPGDRIGLNAWLPGYIFYPIFSQCTTVVIPDRVVLDPGALVAFVRDAGLTQAMITPTLLEGVMDADVDLADAFREVHTLWLSGEKMPDRLRGRFRKRVPHCRMIDLYGSNEASDVAIAEDGGDLRILGGVQAYILGAGMRPVPLGCVGELFVASPGLSSGYFGDDEATSRAFLPNPLAGARPDLAPVIYRTGDHARWTGDDLLELVGRASFQIKIRGFKVIPQNVEHVLGDHPSVSAAVVTTRHDGIAKQLIAYVVPADPKAPPSASALRAWAREQLPFFSVPTAYYRIPSIPATMSQKRDYATIAGATGVERLPEEAELLSGTLAEVAAVWRTVLGDDLPRLSPEDDFFEYGGSLLLTSMSALLKERLGVEVSLSHILDDSTLAGIAGTVEAIRAGQFVKRWIFDLGREAEAHYPFRQSSPRLNDVIAVYRGKAVKRVFLTGITGYLGAFLSAALSRIPDVERVYCLVRASSVSAGYERILENLQRHFLVDASGAEELPAWTRKIAPVCGDLSEDQFGIPNDDYSRLAGETDFAVHCAAEVNWLKSYASLAAVNVTGTGRVLKLAAKANAPMLLVSTIAGAEATTGYNETKLVAERICQRAEEELGLPIVIMRCGDLAAPGSGGEFTTFNKDDYLNLILNACIILQAWPNDVEWSVNLAPVDYAANLLAFIATTSPEAAFGMPKDLYNPQGDTDWRSLCSWARRELPDGQFEPVSLEEWKRKLLGRSAKNTFLRKAELLLPLAIEDFETNTSLGNTLRLERIPCPPIDGKWVGTLVRSLLRSQKTDNQESK